MCPDDTCLLSTTPLGARTALLVAQFSEAKSKVMLCSSKGKADLMKDSAPLLLNGCALEYSCQEYSGFYWLNGVSPETSINMVITYIMPAIKHGIEPPRLSTSDYSVLATFH